MPFPPRAISLVLLLSIALASEVRGEQCPVPRGAHAALAQLDSAVRLRFVRSSLAVAARHGRRWRWGWGITHGTLIAGQLARLPLLPAEARVESYVGAAASAVGIGAVLFQSLPAIAADARLPPATQGVQDAQRSETVECAQLALVEEALALEAAGEARGRHWLMSVASIAFNIGTGAVLALAFQRWTVAGVQAGVGMAVGAAMMNTLPDEAGPALATYRAARLDAPTAAPARTALAWALAPLPVERGAGLALHVAF